MELPLSKISMNFGNGLQIAVALPEDDTRSVRALLGVLPLRSVVRRWGDEICFDAPFHSEKEGNGRVDMEVGDVAFWPDGDAIAVFFGPTPVGRGKKPRAYSPGNILGSVSASA